MPNGTPKRSIDEGLALLVPTSRQWTQREIADICGCSHTAIRKIEQSAIRKIVDGFIERGIQMPARNKFYLEDRKPPKVYDDELDRTDYRLLPAFADWVSEVQAFMDANPDKLFTAAKVQREVSEHRGWDIGEALRACTNVMHVPGLIEYYVSGVRLSPLSPWFGEIDCRRPARKGSAWAR